MNNPTFNQNDISVNDSNCSYYKHMNNNNNHEEEGNSFIENEDNNLRSKSVQIDKINNLSKDVGYGNQLYTDDRDYINHKVENFIKHNK